MKKLSLINLTPLYLVPNTTNYPLKMESVLNNSTQIVRSPIVRTVMILQKLNCVKISKKKAFVVTVNTVTIPITI